MPERPGALPAGRGEAEVVFDDGASVVLRHGHLFVQVRAGRMTVEAIDLLSALWRTMRRTEAEHIGALFVIERTAQLPSAEVRARQAELFREMARDTRLRGAVVIEGGGVEATLKRTVARVLSFGRQVEIVADVEYGVAALARALGPGTRGHRRAARPGARPAARRPRR